MARRQFRHKDKIAMFDWYRHTHQAYLESLLENVFTSSMSSLHAIQRPAGGKPDQMMALPLNPTSQLGVIWQQPIALIVIAEPDTKTPPTSEHLQLLLGFTAAEARVALGISDEMTLDEIASENRVSINTARTQLKQAMHKTDSRRQADLLKTLNLLPKVRDQKERNK